MTVIIGLDGEMSSPDLAAGGVLIQAGAAARGSDGTLSVFSSLIRMGTGPWTEGPVGPGDRSSGAQFWDLEAASVHGITQQQIAEAPTADEVDEKFRSWLLAHGAVDAYRKVLACGFNVAGFDLPFFTATLPRSMELISRRSVDLNACCALLDGWDPNPKITTPRDMWSWKKAAMKQARHKLAEDGVAGAAHDAGYDAAEALVAFDWLRSQLSAGRPQPGGPSAVSPRIRRAQAFARVEAALDRAGVADRAAWWVTAHGQLGGSTPIEELSRSSVLSSQMETLITDLVRQKQSSASRGEQEAP